MGYLILTGWLLFLPLCAGGIFCTKKNCISLTAQWLWGQFLLWALFQPCAVFYILKQKYLEELVPIYIWTSLFAGFVGLFTAIKVRGVRGFVDKSTFKTRFLWIKEQKILTAVFALLWLVQIGMIFLLAVNDGDDAFYMAVANQAVSSGKMYTANVYSFGYTLLNYRYALAPFPIWIAFLSYISGVHTLVIGHVILGIVFITMSYVIFAQTGRELFGLNYRKRLQLLILIAVIYIWGNTSSHTPESFLLLRSRQGKALVSALVFPAMLYLLIKIGHALEQNKNIAWRDFLLATVILLSGCLGSTLGGALILLLWASGLFFLILGYRKWRLLPAGVFSALPGLVFVIIYLLK